MKFANGVAVEVRIGVAVGTITMSGTDVSVLKTSGTGVSGTHPTGVGVRYCPHKDVFPTQADSKKDKRTKGMTNFFTNFSSGNYTCNG
jgi:hypothetical protein